MTDNPIKKQHFETSELAGSRLQCLMMTSQGKRQIAECFNELVKDYGQVDPDIHCWRPEGFLNPDEVQLGRKSPFLNDRQNKSLRDWWLAMDHVNSRLPSWDIVSEVTIGNEKGLVLIEAKAHAAELGKKDKCTASNEANRMRIADALEEASDSLNKSRLTQWNLQCESHYQLNNRFAWSWKLVQMGIPVILIYLGFLNAGEMGDRGMAPFLSHDDWHKAIQNYAAGFIPFEAWDQKRNTTCMPFHVLIRSLRISYSIGVGGASADD